MAMTATLPPFNDLVADAITAHSNISPEQLIVLDNSAKYCPEGINQNVVDKESLAAIFDTMSQLNQTALKNTTLCVGEQGPSFREALLQAVKELIVLLQGRPLRYVELGPEPWKSMLILTEMLKAGVQLEQYIAIDINPESDETMRRALVPIIGSDRFTYWNMDFYKCSVDQFPNPPERVVKEDCVTLITNLGFQEGNDLPARIGPMLTRITRPGDLLLSEMQLFNSAQDDAGTSKIKDFYHHPEMQRFSAIVGQQFESDNIPDSLDPKHRREYLFNLVPLETDLGSMKVATTLVSVRSEGDQKYVLTNSCLKPTADQFQRAREASGNFVVKKSVETGDRSVVFQISQRVGEI